MSRAKAHCEQNYCEGDDKCGSMLANATAFGRRVVPFYRVRPHGCQRNASSCDLQNAFFSSCGSAVLLAVGVVSAFGDAACPNRFRMSDAPGVGSERGVVGLDGQQPIEHVLDVGPDIKKRTSNFRPYAVTTSRTTWSFAATRSNASLRVRAAARSIPNKRSNKTA